MEISKWRKLNHLVPEPDCDTVNDQIVTWRDTRPQPTDVEIDVVTAAQVNASELDTEASNALESDKIKRLLFEVNFEQENRVRALESKPAITKAQYKAAIKDLYKTL